MGTNVVTVAWRMMLSCHIWIETSVILIYLRNRSCELIISELAGIFENCTQKTIVLDDYDDSVYCV